MPRSRQPTLSPAMPLVERLVEHFDARARSSCAACRSSRSISTSSPTLTTPALDTAGGHGAAAFDREHVFDGHQERLVDFADRLGNVGVDRVQQFADALVGLRVGRDCRRPPWRLPRMIGISSPGKPYCVSNSRTSSSTSSSNSGVVDQVDLVQEHDQGRHVRPGGPAGCARGSAASDRRPPRRPGSPPSIWAAPVIMFLMKSAWPGQSMWA